MHAALYASVTGLTHSCTMGETVEMLAAWTDDEECLCFVYQYPAFDGVLGLRCDTQTDMYGEAPTDPGDFGQDVADFDIGEPLGTVVDVLRQDPQGVWWWGTLGTELPPLPESTRLRAVIVDAAEKHQRRREEKAAMPRDGHLARKFEGSDEWMLIAKPFRETWYLSADEAAATDDDIKRRFNLATLSRSDHWKFELGPPPNDDT